MALKITKVNPMFTALITTMNKYEDDQSLGNLIDATKTAGTLKEYQKVIAVGPNVRDIKVGDWVMIDPKRFASIQHHEARKSLADSIVGDEMHMTFQFDTVEINDELYLLLQDRDIKFTFEGEEVPDEPPALIAPPKTNIIGADTPKIIV